MEMTVDKLREILVDRGHLGGEGFALAEKTAVETGKDIYEVLVDQGVFSDVQFGQLVADNFGWKYINLKEEKISPDVFQIIPEVVARSQQAVVFDRTRDSLRIATVHPENYEFIALVEKKVGLGAEVYYATPRSVEDALRSYRSDFYRLITDTIEELSHRLVEEKVVLLADSIIEYGYYSRASDIHLEPFRNYVAVRFRIDGVMHEVTRYTREAHERILFRTKILSRLRTDEHVAPQDGKFRFDKENLSFDIRVSIVPVTYGENMVMRLFAEAVERLRLEELGFSEVDLKKMQSAMQKPYGMILSAGPTGSGKTTTLYAVSQILNRPEVNIMTIEDPVEYEMEGIHQIQVNAKTGLTFATGLRSIVRQDPDIILVGEVRDNETADIAVNAALTGHLLLSTIHANDAATVFPRLTDLGVAPFLVASSVNMVVGQRLVRRICPHCIKSFAISPQELLLLSSQPELVEFVQTISGKKNIEGLLFFKGEGCKTCGWFGYLGRVGIFEVLEVTDEVRSLIVDKKSADVIRQKAVQGGMRTMLFDGINKVFLGSTTLAEVIRVTKT